MSDWDYDEAKFAEALLYVAKGLEDDPAGGATKINKTLFNADFGHMRAHRRPITGAQYQKLPQGPAPRRLLPVRTRLIEAGDAVVRDETFLGRTIHRLVPLREPDVHLLQDTEIELLDQAIAAMRGRTGRDVSEASHLEPGWEMVDDNETIPYEAAFLRPPVVTPQVKRRIVELAQHHLG
jgi:hypothetical protein